MWRGRGFPLVRDCGGGGSGEQRLRSFLSKSLERKEERKRKSRVSDGMKR